MKNIVKYALIVLLAVFLLPVACTKSGSGGARQNLPDISDFRIESATGFPKGSTSKVTVYCSSIGSGTYNVHYDLAGSNILKAQTAKLVMSNNRGTFTTAKIPNLGLTFLTINSITNTNGGGTALSENNKYTLSDSTGIMMALVDSYLIFKATNLQATVDGTNLTITGIMPEPYTSTITLRLNKFNYINGTYNFSSYIVPQIAQGQYTSSTYPGGGFLSANGQIKITSIQPTLTGTFYFRGMDSTDITGGSFDMPTPE